MTVFGLSICYDFSLIDVAFGVQQVHLNEDTPILSAAEM